MRLSEARSRPPPLALWAGLSAWMAVVAFDARSQLGWEYVGGKKIMHELNYAREVEPHAIEDRLGKQFPDEPVNVSS